jgi:hypothetical protein
MVTRTPVDGNTHTSFNTICHNGIISTKNITPGQDPIINEYKNLKHQQLFIVFKKL